MENSMQRDATAENEDERKEWQTPDLIVEDVEKQTQGGTTGDIDPVDDAWYS